jgi:hypothetical protein
MSAPAGFHCPFCDERLADRDAFACHISAEHRSPRRARRIRLAFLKARWQQRHTSTEVSDDRSPV